MVRGPSEDFPTHQRLPERQFLLARSSSLTMQLKPYCNTHGKPSPSAQLFERAKRYFRSAQSTMAAGFGSRVVWGAVGGPVADAIAATVTEGRARSCRTCGSKATRAKTSTVREGDNCSEQRAVSCPVCFNVEEPRLHLEILSVIKPGNTREKIAFFIRNQCSVLNGQLKVKSPWEQGCGKAKRRRKSQDTEKETSSEAEEDVKSCGVQPTGFKLHGEFSVPEEASTNENVVQESDMLSVLQKVAILEGRKAGEESGRVPANGTQEVDSESNSPTIGAMRLNHANSETSESVRVTEVIARLEFESLRHARDSTLPSACSLSRNSSLRRSFRKIYISGAETSSNPSDVPPAPLPPSRNSTYSSFPVPPSTKLQPCSTPMPQCTLYAKFPPPPPAPPAPEMRVHLRYLTRENFRDASGSRILVQNTEEFVNTNNTVQCCASSSMLEEHHQPSTDHLHHKSCTRTVCNVNKIKRMTSHLQANSSMNIEPCSQDVSDAEIPGRLFLFGSLPSIVRQENAFPRPKPSRCLEQTPKLVTKFKRTVSHEFLEMRFRIQQLLEPRQYMLSLPDHVLAQVFSCLPTKCLAALKCTCRDFKWLIEAYDIRATDSRWSNDPRYSDDPCKQCRRKYQRGDVSLCRWHPKPFHQDLLYGRSYWMCCRRAERDAPGCRVGLHDNNWVQPSERLQQIRRFHSQELRIEL
uniref:F-box only protein 46-like isoform X1 n=1 Tax=Myxine glutinosa TaxID=7769 RepID=UPI00358FD6EC